MSDKNNDTKTSRIKITEKEKSILEDISDQTEFYGLGGYIYFDEYNMNVYRGVISSLIKKGICEIDENCSSNYNGDINYLGEGQGYIWLFVTHPELFDMNDPEQNFLWDKVEVVK